MGKFDIAFWIAVGIAVCLLARFGYLVLKKGWGWALAKLKAWWSAGAADLATLDARLTAVEVKVGIKSAPVAAAPAATTAAAPAA